MLGVIKKPMRYAHSEGHTDVCYFTGEKGGLITCGTDGDVRAWINLMDDDPSASCISEQVTCVISKKEKLYAGNDNNTIQILSYPHLEKEGLVTRFSATISALATTKNSDLIVSGACDMRIQVSNIKTSESIEFNGHEAPILGLTLDPKEEYFASSSGDSTIRVWSIKDKRAVHTLSNIVPKCNSFFNATAYGVPSFHPSSGQYLAYPHGKEVVILERSSWKEEFRLRDLSIKNELSICKFSECGNLIAASSIYGELIVWDFLSKEVIGYVEHQQNAKITALVWDPKKSNEIAYCDALGQLSCVEVQVSKSNGQENSAEQVMTNGDAYDDNFLSDDNDDDISLNKIKASIVHEQDNESVAESASEKKTDEKHALPEINLQEPFQPGSSPVHLLSRYMVWNDVGMVMCYTSEDDEDSHIEVNFHDVTVHHSMHINNYLRHTMAALSVEALVLSGPALEGASSKLVVVALQGWGSGNKEWTADLPDNEEALAVAAGSNFVAVATNARNLRLFMPSGIQREVVALPGPVVAMNGLGHNLAVTYHSSLGAFGDQNLSLQWIRINGRNLKSHATQVPLSPASNLMWVGFTDLGSPVIMDAEGIINLYDKKAMLWRVACNTNRLAKGKFDNYFIIGVSESDSTMRCILCKGSHYPLTAPKPIVGEVPLKLPLCDPESEKSINEAKLWQLSNDSLDQAAVLALIAASLTKNIEFRAIDLCQQIANQKIMEVAIRFAGKLNKVAVANKLQSIAELIEADEINTEADLQEDIFNNRIEAQIDDDDDLLAPTLSVKKPDIEIKPLTPSQPFGRRSNPFAKKSNTPVSKGLSGFNTIEEPARPVITAEVHVPTPKPKERPKNNQKEKETFVSWFQKNKSRMEEENPNLHPSLLTKEAFAKFKLIMSSETNHENDNNSLEEDTNKKRKLNDESNDENKQTKRLASDKLAAFARDS